MGHMYTRGSVGHMHTRMICGAYVHEGDLWGICTRGGSVGHMYMRGSVEHMYTS